jgi:hypothetical protein
MLARDIQQDYEPNVSHPGESRHPSCETQDGISDSAGMTKEVRATRFNAHAAKPEGKIFS